MATSIDLTSLANVKAYLGITDTSSDTILQRFLTAMSSAFLAEVSRAIVLQTYVDTFNGSDPRVRIAPALSPYPGAVTYGTDGFAGVGYRGYAINLEQYPVQSVTSVVIDGTTIPQRPDVNSDGWVLEDQRRIELVGYRFTPNVQNCIVTYTAGFQTSDSATIPGTPYQVQTQYLFTSDVSVTIAGVAATKVASAPATGQYSVSSTGLYTFAAADAGKAAVVTYGYIPGDIEEAVIEMVALRHRERDRVGQISATHGGETVQFIRDAWPAMVQQTIDKYARINI